MLCVEEEAPSRFDLLSMVRKHSNLLGKTAVEEQEASDVEMDGQFWHDVFNLYFLRGKESRGRQDDDLIFFVRKWRGHGFNHNNNGVAPYFVRRWAPELDKLDGESLSEVDWKSSFYLNMIAHTLYSVTVAICSHHVLRNHQAGQDTPLSAIYNVVKTVFASPSRVNFHLDSKKASLSILSNPGDIELSFNVCNILTNMDLGSRDNTAYPDICFTIDDFDFTFDAVVLTDTDHCYFVLLNALDGAAFPTEKDTNDSSSSKKLPLRLDTNSLKTKNCKSCDGFGIPLVSLSGTVSSFYQNNTAGCSRFESLLSIGHSSGKTDRLYMKGPGGHGEVEVTVSVVADQSKQYSGTFSPVMSKKGFGLGSIVRKAASIASVAAKHANAAAAATSTSDEEMIPLKCGLMSITLPWEHIAYDLLFREALR